ncbi:protein of unknown function [Nitrospira japonica]|uniref:Uncharacterized protein n=1 Tax=Nitrospira japonica TaxID=1325564 RepID=A0A1W1I1Y0_9BACT|nr:protein of unknown function [Nitrospira japonica]
MEEAPSERAQSHRGILKKEEFLNYVICRAEWHDSSRQPVWGGQPVCVSPHNYNADFSAW